MITKYRAYGCSIKKVECHRETAKSVWLKSFALSEDDGQPEYRRAAKISNFECFFDTWEEAHTHLLQRTKAQVDSLRLRLERAKTRFCQIRGMNKEDCK